MKKALLFPLLLVLAFLLLAGCVSDSTGNAGIGSAPTNSSMSIPVDTVGPQAKFFEYESNGTTVRFFAVKASDGTIKTAFDACDVCFGSKKGYSQQGSNMVCNNCGNKYPIDGLGTENRNPGGCWPSYLPNKVVGNSVVIEKADLDAGRRFFT